MARNITGSDRNELKIYDNLSDSEIVLYYRNPTTKERNGYGNMAIQRRRNKVVMNQAEARLHYGLKILTGFRDGDFVRDVDGKAESFSSDPAAKNYLPTWKEELGKGAADLVMLLAGQVFDSSGEIQAPDEPEPEAEGEDAQGNSMTTSPQ